MAAVARQEFVNSLANEGNGDLTVGCVLAAGPHLIVIHHLPELMLPVRMHGIELDPGRIGHNPVHLAVPQPNGGGGVVDEPLPDMVVLVAANLMDFGSRLFQSREKNLTARLRHPLMPVVLLDEGAHFPRIGPLARFVQISPVRDDAVHDFREMLVVQHILIQFDIALLRRPDLQLVSGQTILLLLGERAAGKGVSLRNLQCPRPVPGRGGQRGKQGGPGDFDGDGMHIESLNQSAHHIGLILRTEIPTGHRPGFQNALGRLKEKSPGAAGGIQHSDAGQRLPRLSGAVLQRCIDAAPDPGLVQHFLANRSGNPVGRVDLSEIVPGGWINQTLIQALQHILAVKRPTPAGDAPFELIQPSAPALPLQNPGGKVAFQYAAGRGASLSGQHPNGRAGHADQQCVIDEEIPFVCARGNQAAGRHHLFPKAEFGPIRLGAGHRAGKLHQVCVFALQCAAQIFGNRLQPGLCRPPQMLRQNVAQAERINGAFVRLHQFGCALSAGQCVKPRIAVIHQTAAPILLCISAALKVEALENLVPEIDHVALELLPLRLLRILGIAVGETRRIGLVGLLGLADNAPALAENVAALCSLGPHIQPDIGAADVLEHFDNALADFVFTDRARGHGMLCLVDSP